MRPASGNGIQDHTPLPVGSGSGLLGLITQYHDDLFASICPAPYRIGKVSLQYQMIGKQGR